MDTTQYLGIFIDEATEHLGVLSSKLIELEKNPNEKSIIEEIFRSAHTLKGMSATMGYTDLANLTHHLEDVFDGIRYDKISVTAEMIDLLFEVLDHLTAIVTDISNGGDGSRDIALMISHLSELGTTKDTHARETAATMVPGHSEVTKQRINSIDQFELGLINAALEQGLNNYEITVQLREDCLLKGVRVFMIFEVLEKLGEVIKAEPPVTELEDENFDESFTVLLVSNEEKSIIKEKVMNVSEVDHVEVLEFNVNNKESNEVNKDKQTDENSSPSSNNADTSKNSSVKTAVKKTIRVSNERLDTLMNLFEELVIDRGRLEQISSELENPSLQETVERITRVSSDLQSIILTIRMVPIEQVFDRFPRMIRQLARELNKKVEIDIIGAETELDRTIVDEIGDPLVHLIRNAIDHGIETPDIRKKNGKTKHGSIKLEAYHSGNHVFIEITDDGAGINREKVIQKAIENNVLNKEEAEMLTDKQVYELIMESGFSTAEVLSDISGRGVGLDVVKSKIQSLGGNITIDATPGMGSTFSIQLPLTLSIIPVLLVQLSTEKYAIPLSSIIETAVIKKEEIKYVHQRRVIDFRGKVVPLVFLSKVFNSEQSEEDQMNKFNIVIVKRGDKVTAFVVDSFVGQQEVVLKPLGGYLRNTFAISGATILGDGQVALIIDSNALVK